MVEEAGLSVLITSDLVHLFNFSPNLVSIFPFLQHVSGEAAFGTSASACRFFLPSKPSKGPATCVISACHHAVLVCGASRLAVFA